MFHPEKIRAALTAKRNHFVDAQRAMSAEKGRLTESAPGTPAMATNHRMRLPAGSVIFSNRSGNDADATAHCPKTTRIVGRG
jgi:hypothetical protein